MPRRQPRLAAPEFTVNGVDGITSLRFHPAVWPPEPGTDDHGTVMSVIHRTSNFSREITIHDLDTLARWFSSGVTEYEITGPDASAHFEWSFGYIQVAVRRDPYAGHAHTNTAFRTSLDPRAVGRVSTFLADLRLMGWEVWNASQ